MHCPNTNRAITPDRNLIGRRARGHGVSTMTSPTCGRKSSGKHGTGARMNASDDALTLLVEHLGKCCEQGTTSQEQGWDRGFRTGSHRGSLS
jgi:hypothetical protein